MVSALPQDAKDLLVVMLIDKKKGSIIHAAEEYADSKGITIHIQEVCVEKSNFDTQAYFRRLRLLHPYEGGT